MNNFTDSQSVDQKIIVYIGGFELPDVNAAGLRVANNAKIFQSLGYRVILVGVSKNRPNDGQIYPVENNDNDIESWEMGYPSGGKTWIQRASSDAPLRQILAQEEIKKLDMVICYNHPAVSQWRISRLARKFGALAIADCTEWYARRHWNSIFGTIKNLDVALRMRIVNKQMDGLITTSPFISDYYRGPNKPIVEIPTLMEAPVLDNIPTINRVDGKTQLFFAGSGFDKFTLDNSTEGLKDRLDWVFPILHKAKQLGANFHMDLYGVSLEQYAEIIPEQRGILNDMRENLSFHGRQSRDILLRTLPAAAFSIFVRNRTRTNLAGFPSKFSESISFGTPVITNDMPSSGQFMLEGRTGFNINTNDHDVAAKQLIKIFAHTDEEINDMKSYCYHSKMFEVPSFIKPVKSWLDDLNF